MSILVTGGAGFIGSHFIERLLESDGAVEGVPQGNSESIVCLDNFNDYYDPACKRRNVAGFLDHQRVTLVEETFCNVEAMRRLFDEHQVRVVVHLGAFAGVFRSVIEPLMYQENNVGGTLSLLEAARHHPVERFLLASSSTVYGRGAAIPFQEDAPHGIPMSPYGASKRAAELMGLTYHGLHGTPVVCLRPFSVYGPRVRPDLAMAIFVEAIETGRPLPLFGDGSIRRDFTHVRDICSGLLSAMTAEGVEGETINLGHHDPIEIRQVIEIVEEALGKKANIDQQPEKPGDMPVTFADLTKAERLLGYRPEVPFAEGVADYVAWFRRDKTGQV